jgi:hypothetical protein
MMKVLPEDLCHALETHSHGELTVASEFVEPISTEVDGHQGHVRVVHSLELDTTVAAVPGGFLKEILQGLQDLLEEISLDETGLKHLGDL